MSIRHPVTQHIVTTHNDRLDHLHEQVEDLISQAERAAEIAVASDALDAAREERRRVSLLRTAGTILRSCRRPL